MSRERAAKPSPFLTRYGVTGFAGLLFLCAFAVISAGFAIYQLQLRHVQSEAERTLDSAVAGLTDALLAADSGAIKILSARILDFPQARRVLLLDADGRTRLDATGGGDQRASPDAIAVWIPQGASAFHLSRALTRNGNKVGSIRIDYDARLLAITFSWIALMSATLVCASLLLAWYGYRRLNNAVIIPINAIERISNEITRTGNLSHRLPHSGSNDTVAIETTVNKLLSELDEQEKKRALYRAHLEREVARRTTALANSNERLQKLAFLSVETQLPNRAAFLNRLHQLCVIPRDDDKAVCLFVVHIALVRYANEAFGFDVGDMVIESAARVQMTMQTPDVEVFHLGGGEFAWVQVGEPDLMHSYALDILRIDDVAFTYQGATLHFQPRIGYALHPQDAAGVDELTRFSMLALSAVTASESTASVVRYVPALLAEAVSVTQLETAIKEAIDSGLFEPHFQSRVDTHTGQIHGLEALIRWSSPRLDGYSNYQLIPIAERSLLVTELDSEMLRKVMRWLGKLALDGIRIPVAINLSARSLGRAALPDEVAALIRMNGLHTQQIELELTETALIKRNEVVSRNLALFREMGVGLLLDDFGSGYSSLRYLYELPISTVKIDALFVRGLPNDQASLAIVESTINLAHRLGKRVVAEGVETYAQWELLRSLGADEVQGYFLMRPQSADVVATMLQQQFDTSVGRLTMDMASIPHEADLQWPEAHALAA